jgi:mannose-P-dolichol utilization defect 1
MARLFTTSAEVGDLILTAGFALALLLNIVLGIQMWTYWGKDGRDTKIPVEHRVEEVEMENIPAAAWQENGKVEVIIQPATPISPATPRQQGSRKWARKVD